MDLFKPFEIPSSLSGEANVKVNVNYHGLQAVACASAKSLGHDRSVDVEFARLQSEDGGP